MSGLSTFTNDSVDFLFEQMMSCCRASASILEKQIHSLEKMPKIKVSGHLAKNVSEDRIRWYRILNRDEQKGGSRGKTYLGKADEKVLQQLAYKTFLLSSLYVKKGQLAAAHAFLRKMEQIPKNCLKTRCDPDLRSLLNPSLPDQSQSIRKELSRWQSEQYQGNPFHPEMLKIRAAGNRMVRSKSEAIIVSELVKRNIPFRYESPVVIQNVTVYPDFTIRHPITGKTYLWEHLGMMDDPGYASNAAKKIEAYIHAGYIPMVNLLLTSETKDCPFDYGMARMMIEYYFALPVNLHE